jgi:4-hydroxybenzoate polyprenyltransferase
MYSYLRLFRWPNLLMVALTQYLLRYAIIIPILNQHNIEPGLSHISFFFLVLATLLIAAAGYAINDYFDLHADRINKPGRILLGRVIARRKAILLHSLLNFAGVAIGAGLSILIGSWQLLFIFIVIPFLLWMYSIRYKKRFLAGNVLVAALSAFVVSLVWVFDFNALNHVAELPSDAIENINLITRIYALFAFVTTLMREIIKDVEDIKGDSRTGCKTIPLAIGITHTKWIISLLQTSIIAAVLFVQICLLQRDFDLLFAYLIVFVQLPGIYLIHKTISAADKDDYSGLSRLSKIIILMGILSMILFRIYFDAGMTVVEID